MCTVKIHDDTAVNNGIYVDTSLMAIRATFGQKVCMLQIHEIRQMLYNILHILVILRLCGAQMKNQHCTVYCDNIAVVNVYTHHKIQDPFLMACVRSVGLICAINKKPSDKGQININADILSRWQTYSNYNYPFVEMLKTCK